VPYFRYEIYYDDEIEAEDEDEAHTVIVGALAMGVLDLTIDIEELQE
jgi:hypothetical protein